MFPARADEASRKLLSGGERTCDLERQCGSGARRVARARPQYRVFAHTGSFMIVVATHTGQGSRRGTALAGLALARLGARPRFCSPSSPRRVEWHHHGHGPALPRCCRAARQGCRRQRRVHPALAVALPLPLEPQLLALRPSSTASKRERTSLSADRDSPARARLVSRRVRRAAPRQTRSRSAWLGGGQAGDGGPGLEGQGAVEPRGAVGQARTTCNPARCVHVPCVSPRLEAPRLTPPSSSIASASPERQRGPLVDASRGPRSHQVARASCRPSGARGPRDLDEQARPPPASASRPRRPPRAPRSSRTRQQARHEQGRQGPLQPAQQAAARRRRAQAGPGRCGNFQCVRLALWLPRASLTLTSYLSLAVSLMDRVVSKKTGVVVAVKVNPRPAQVSVPAARRLLPPPAKLVARSPAPSPSPPPPPLPPRARPPSPPSPPKMPQPGRPPAEAYFPSRTLPPPARTTRWFTRPPINDLPRYTQWVPPTLNVDRTSIAGRTDRRFPLPPPPPPSASASLPALSCSSSTTAPSTSPPPVAPRSAIPLRAPANGPRSMAHLLEPAPAAAPAPRPPPPPQQKQLKSSIKSTGKRLWDVLDSEGSMTVFERRTRMRVGGRGGTWLDGGRQGGA